MNTSGVQNGEVQQAQIKNVQKECRYCIGCQHAAIPPEAPEWKVRCNDCYKNKVSNRYCTDCGSDLESDRVHYARSQGSECKRCRYCTKKPDAEFNPRFCPNCKVLHPEDWFCPAPQIF